MHTDISFFGVGKRKRGPAVAGAARATRIAAAIRADGPRGETARAALRQISKLASPSPFTAYRRVTQNPGAGVSDDDELARLNRELEELLEELVARFPGEMSAQDFVCYRTRERQLRALIAHAEARKPDSPRRDDA